MSVTLKILPADSGDSILIKFQSEDNQYHNILIDGGLVNSYNYSVKKEILNIYENHELLDLIIVTHIDCDHINGIRKFVSEIFHNKLDNAISIWGIVGKMWFNSGSLLARYFETTPEENRAVHLFNESRTDVGVVQGVELEKYLIDTDKWHNTPIKSVDKFNIAGADITILSPNEKMLSELNQHWRDELIPSTDLGAKAGDYKQSISELSGKRFEEDNSIPNGSSIAFLFEFAEKKALLLGDAHPSVIIESLTRLKYSKENKLKVNCVKLSHHGSRGNTKYELLAMIESQKYIISSNGMNRDRHPHKEALSRIICNPERAQNQGIELIFNYRNQTLESIFSDIDREQYNYFQCRYPGTNDRLNGVDILL